MHTFLLFYFEVKKSLPVFVILRWRIGCNFAVKLIQCGNHTFSYFDIFKFKWNVTCHYSNNKFKNGKKKQTGDQAFAQTMAISVYCQQRTKSHLLHSVILCLPCIEEYWYSCSELSVILWIIVAKQSHPMLGLGLKRLGKMRRVGIKGKMG